MMIACFALQVANIVNLFLLYRLILSIRRDLDDAHNRINATRERVGRLEDRWERRWEP